MSTLVLQRCRGVLVPVDDASRAFVAALLPGDGVEVDATAHHNVRLHRKLFALLRLAYDAWEPLREHDERLTPIKSFEAFRKDVLILAGHADTEVTPKGNVRVVARSMAFAVTDGAALPSLYERVFEVLWERVLKHCRYRSPAEVEQTLARIVDFGS